jgi:hypothetical protein
MLRWFPSSYCMLLMQSSRFKLIKITPLLWRPLSYLTFQIIISTFTNQEIKIPLSLSQALAAYHPNVFTLILPLGLSEGRASIAWGPSNNKEPFFSRNKISLTSLRLQRIRLCRSDFDAVTYTKIIKFALLCTR